jgi:hypothetical protein
MKFKVTCLLNISTDEPERVFASRSKEWDSRDEAEKYAATIAPSREPIVCGLEQGQNGNWIAVDNDPARVMIGPCDTEIEAALAYAETVTQFTF